MLTERCPAARLVIGPFCERFGPRRVMAALLLIGAVPCAMTGLIQNAGGLIGLRYKLHGKFREIALTFLR